MTHIPSTSNRPRQPGYEYICAEAYYVAIDTHQHLPLFEDVQLRMIVERAWRAVPDRFPAVRLDAWAVMPSHFRAVIWLNEPSTPMAFKPSIGTVVGSFKAFAAVQWAAWLRDVAPERPAEVWQHGFYEQFIRDAHQLTNVRRYIGTIPDSHINSV